MIDEQDQSTLGHTSQRDMMEPYGANICMQVDRVSRVFVRVRQTQKVVPKCRSNAVGPVIYLHPLGGVHPL